MGNLKQALRSLDAFPRAEEHLLLKTKSGALGIYLFIFFFFVFFEDYSLALLFQNP